MRAPGACGRRSVAPWAAAAPLAALAVCAACATGVQNQGAFDGSVAHESAAGDAGDDGDAEACATGQTQCQGNQVQLCNAGQWGSPSACASGTCQDGACSGTTTMAASCKTAGKGLNDCGSASESCCTSLEVPGGTFFRGEDGVTSGYTSKRWPATVTGLRLDKYLVTVGRFRKFVAAVVGGYAPSPGDGKHVELDSGAGLKDTQGGNEGGWSAAWTSNLATTTAAWNTALGCSVGFQTWTNAPGMGEGLPINCVSWFEAYAFCIWDGGFLPTEAEWNLAAAGGADQRVYPWSSPPSSTTIDCSYVNFNGDGSATCGAGPSPVGTQSPKGDGKWGQSDLSGNVWEWTLDWYPASGFYPLPCVNCSDTVGTDSQDLRVRRGGAFYENGSAVVASVRGSSTPALRNNATGLRCARTP